MQLTSNYSLKKPELTDNYNIQDQNDNMELLDAALTPTGDATQVPSSNGPFKVHQWVNYIINRIKAITGKTNWFDTPTKSMEQLNTDINTHTSDRANHISYAVTTGNANTYSIALSPAPSSYVTGMGVCVKINAANTGASTINVNGLGAKSIKKSNGSEVTTNFLKTGGVYTLRFDGTNFILQGEGGEGTAQPGDVLNTKTFTNDSGDLQAGAMPNNGILSYTPGTADQSIPAGYTSGGTVSGDTDLVAPNILIGANIFGVNGSAKRSASGTSSADSNGDLNITGLSFTPTCVAIRSSWFSNPSFYIRQVVSMNGFGHMDKAATNGHIDYSGYNNAYYVDNVITLTNGLRRLEGGFSCDGLFANQNVNWYAME